VALAELSIGELLSLSRGVLGELRARGVIRTANAPTGDYAEWLAARATKVRLDPSSKRSWDLVSEAGERVQVKARVVTEISRPGQRQLSPFRSWAFDAALIVLFDERLTVRRAAWLAVEEVRAAARADPHVNAARVIATDALLARGTDWTERLREAALHQDRQADAR
jgi:hypothetical protein